MATFNQILFDNFILDVDNDSENEDIRIIYRYVDTPTDPSARILVEWKEFGTDTWAELQGGPVWSPPYIFDSNYQYCNGANLQKFRLQSQYPYAYKYEIENSPVCSVAVCDIEIQTPITITPESSTGAGDASIVVQASSSNGAISYSLNNVDYQASNVFTGLSAGEYVVYAKDTNGCTAEVNIEIPEPAVYGQEYYYHYYDNIGNLFQLIFYRKDYDGQLKTLPDAVKGSLIHRYNKSGDDKTTVIKASQFICSFYAQEDDQFFDFYTSDEFEIKLEVYKNTDLFYVGFVLQNQYQEAFKSVPYPISIVTNDGLALLKEHDFVNVDGSIIYGQILLSDVLKICLGKLGLGLDIYERINIYEENHDKVDSGEVSELEYIEIRESSPIGGYGGRVALIIEGSVATGWIGKEVEFNSNVYGLVKAKVVARIYHLSAGETELVVEYPYNMDDSEGGILSEPKTYASPLQQTTVDAERFLGLNCYQVIESVLEIFCARIFQQNGAWEIEQINEKSITHKRRRYDSEYNFISEEDYDPVKLFQKLTDKNDPGTSFFINQSGNIITKTPFAKVVIEQDLGTVEDMVKGGGLTEEDFGPNKTPLYWAGNAIVSRRAGEDDELFGFAIDGNHSDINAATKVSQVLRKAVREAFAPRDWINLSFKFKPIIEGTIQDNYSSKVYFQLKVTSGNFTAYLQENGDFFTTPAKIPIVTEDVNEWNKFSMELKWFFAYEYDFELTFYQGEGFFYTLKEVVFSEIKCIYSPGGDKAVKSRTIEALNTNKYKFKPNTFKVILGDGDDSISNFKYLFRGVLLLKNGEPTQFWTREGFNEAKGILNIMADNILNLHYQPWKTLSGQIRSNQLRFNQTIFIPEISEAYWMINSWQYITEKNLYDIEFVQIERPGFTGIQEKVKLLANGNFKYLANGGLKLLNEE